MRGLTATLLGKACRIFLALAYADGQVPAAKRPYAEIQSDQVLEPLLTPPVCQPLPAVAGVSRGYAFRLGCSWFPHLKLQVVDCGTIPCVFAVDTHDAMKLEGDHPEAERWSQLQESNRSLKLRIERAWEQEGLMTFNELLRQGLAPDTSGP